MSGETAARWDQSMNNNNNNNSSEHVPLAQHEILKAKYETLNKEHENLIKTLEILEKTHGFTVEDLEKKQRETEKWKNKFGEMEKKLEKMEKGIEDLMLLDETEKKGMDSGTAGNLNVKSNTVSDEGVILISDDEEGNQRESNGGHSNSMNHKPEFSFIL